MLIQLTITGDYLPAEKFTRRWIEPGKICNLGRGVLLQVQKNRDAISGKFNLVFVVQQHIEHTGLANRFAVPVQRMNLTPWCGIEALPRAVDENGRVFIEFRQTGELEQEARQC